MSIRRLFTILGLAALLAVGSSAVGEERKMVSLLLTKASAKRDTDDVLFRCDAVLDNTTGKDLTVRSPFFSAFDGLELVVTTPDGKVLAQQQYIRHQSPYGPLRDFTLRPGRNEDLLVFPMRGLPADGKAFKVRLVGTLPRSGYDRILSSETLEVQVK